MSALDERLGEIADRAAAVDAAQAKIDDCESRDENYVITLVAHVVHSATEASALDVPTLAAALRAVLALHQAVPVYDLDDECACLNRDDHEVMESRTGDTLCLASPRGDFICDECSRDGVEDEVSHPCPTVRAITAVLDAS